MINAEAIAVIGSIGAVVLGYVGTHANNKALEIRQARLARLDSQLRDLYGPLVAVLEPQGVLFELWRMRRLNLEKGWTGSDEPDREEWRHWMLTVLMPLNRRAAEIIATNAHLIQDQQMPPELTALCAHIENYEPLAARWNKGEFDRWMPYVLFPRNVRDYATTVFSELKREQSSLLGRRWWHGLILRKLYRAPIRTPKTWQDYVKDNRRYFRDAQLDDWPNSLDTSQRDPMYGDAYQPPEGWPGPKPAA